MTIVLRTVCGCERTLDIPYRSPPSTYSVPYIRNKTLHVFAADGGTCMSAVPWSKRVFEFTGKTGIYGYWLYIEQVDDCRS